MIKGIILSKEIDRKISEAYENWYVKSNMYGEEILYCVIDGQRQEIARGEFGYYSNNRYTIPDENGEEVLYCIIDGQRQEITRGEFTVWPGGIHTKPAIRGKEILYCIEDGKEKRVSEGNFKFYKDGTYAKKNDKDKDAFYCIENGKEEKSRKERGTCEEKRYDSRCAKGREITLSDKIYGNKQVIAEGIIKFYSGHTYVKEDEGSKEDVLYCMIAIDLEGENILSQLKHYKFSSEDLEYALLLLKYMRKESYRNLKIDDAKYLTGVYVLVKDFKERKLEEERGEEGELSTYNKITDMMDKAIDSDFYDVEKRNGYFLEFLLDSEPGTMNLKSAKEYLSEGEFLQ